MKVRQLALVALLQFTSTAALQANSYIQHTGGGSWNSNTINRNTVADSTTINTHTSGTSRTTRLFASSAFGKAAIGKQKKKRSHINKSHDIQIQNTNSSNNSDDDTDTDNDNDNDNDNNNSDNDKRSNINILRTAMSTEQVIKRRDNALIALQTHLQLPTQTCNTILNRHPRLYTHIPNLSSKLTYLTEEINLKPTIISKMLTSHPRLMETVFLDREDNLLNTMDVLQQELDLSEKEIIHIQNHSLPTILSYNRSELRKRIQVFKNDLQFTKEEIKILVLKDSRMLRTDSTKTRRLLLALKEELGLETRDVVQMLNKEILLLTYNAEENIRPTIQFLMRGKVGTCLGMVERKGVSTGTTSADLESGLLSHEEIKGEKEQIIKERLKALVMGHPKVLSASLERNLKPTIDFFLRDVGLTELEFGKVMYRRGGSLLEANVERTLTRKVDFLRDELGLELDMEDVDDDVHVHVHVHVDVHIDDIHMDPNDVSTQRMDVGEQVKLEPRFPSTDAYAEQDGTRKQELTNHEKKRLLAQMIATAPDILTLSIDKNLKPKFDYFRHELNFTKEQLQYIILKRPQLLALNLDRNIIPKVEFFLRERQVVSVDTVVEKYEGGLGMTMDEIREWIVQFPQTLTFVLDSRIRPRTFDVVKHDLQIGESYGMAPMNFISRNEPSWKKWMEANVEC